MLGQGLRAFAVPKTEAQQTLLVLHRMASRGFPEQRAGYI